MWYYVKRLDGKGEGGKFTNFFRFPLDSGGRTGYNVKVFKDSRRESVSPAENAANPLSLRCFRVDTKAAFFFRRHHLFGGEFNNA